MIKLHLDVMSGIICRITIVCLLFAIFGCKKESIKKAFKESVLNINDRID
jgi:hypothetical protein